MNLSPREPQAGVGLQIGSVTKFNAFADQAVDEAARFNQGSSQGNAVVAESGAGSETLVTAADIEFAIEADAEASVRATNSSDQINEDAKVVEVAREYRKALLACAFVGIVIAAGVGTSIWLAAQRSDCSAEELARNDLDICMPCSAGGYVLPLGGEVEQRMHWALRGFIYFFTLGWMFTGVGLVCDIFMGAIEAITCQERLIKIVVKGQERCFQVQIWNSTVANLSLMALGSSAPEILLNIIEVLGGRFFTGQLGPATIVGSAAFNLLVISAVCISAIPVDEVRKIDATAVFGVTAVTSVFAYVWLLLVLVASTPNRVDIWESVLTLLYFPLFVVVAYMADIGCWPFQRKPDLPEEKEEEEEDKFGNDESVNVKPPLIELSSQGNMIIRQISVSKKYDHESLAHKLSKMADCEDITCILGDRVQASESRHTHRRQMFSRLTRAVTKESEWTNRTRESGESGGKSGESLGRKTQGSAQTQSSAEGLGCGRTLSSVTDLPIVIRNTSDSCQSKTKSMHSILSQNEEATSSWSQQWHDQFREAFYVGGNPDDQAEAGFGDWCCHCLSLCWKLLAASIPPASISGGWYCFFGALFWIGVLTLVIGECASLLGCSVGIERETCAITLVALGTSLPDTFASRAAALQDPNADNSIGNITGSNSVNVFLGMGIPWTVASVYWGVKGANGATKEWLEHSFKGGTYGDVFQDAYPSGGFMVPAGTLGLNVCIFSASALLCIASLVWRRRAYGGELGGPHNRAHSVCLLLLWCAYIVASIIIAKIG